jgi:hypothetical protein
MKTPSELVLNPQPVSENGEPPVTSSHSIEGRGFGPSSTNELIIPIAINILPATPDVPQRRASADNPMDLTLLSGQDEKPSSSTDRDRDMSKGKRVQQMLKNRVHKGQSTISTFSKKIGHGVVRNGSLRRSISTPG